MDSFPSTTPQARPMPLVIVALAFIGSGIWAIWMMSRPSPSGHLMIRLDVVHLLVGVGLLRLRPFWRKAGVFLAAFTMVISFVGAALVLFFGVTSVAGFSALEVRLGCSLAGMGLGLFSWWGYGVLTRPEIKALFPEKQIQPPI
ncbi:MAG: hypothetical protein QM796_14930 [Chthoniobacteraceae bacterium]